MWWTEHDGFMEYLSKCGIKWISKKGKLGNDFYTFQFINFDCITAIKVWVIELLKLSKIG